METIKDLDSVLAFQTSQGLDIQATPLRLTRYLAVFEVYAPNLVLQISEVLSDFKIRFGERIVYAGRAVVSSLINAGTTLICEGTLEESWLDVEFVPAAERKEVLQTGFERFMHSAQKAFQVRPEFKIVIADMQNFLMDLRGWLEQIELGVRAEPAGDRQQSERGAIQALEGRIMPLLGSLFERFEEACKSIEPDFKPAHRSYVKRQL